MPENSPAVVPLSIFAESFNALAAVLLESGDPRARAAATMLMGVGLAFGTQAEAVKTLSYESAGAYLAGASIAAAAACALPLSELVGAAVIAFGAASASPFIAGVFAVGVAALFAYSAAKAGEHAYHVLARLMRGESPFSLEHPALPNPRDPLVLDLTGTGIQLTSALR
jgi:hypothetical protein